MIRKSITHVLFFSVLMMTSAVAFAIPAEVHHGLPWQQLQSVTIYPGSLKSNIERAAHELGWSQVVWNLPNDYRWTGVTVVRAGNLQDLLNQLLRDYPMQAVFYLGNHVLVIQPRTLK